MRNWLITLLAMLLAFTACQPEPIVPDIEDSFDPAKLHFNLAIQHPEGTTKGVKSNWENGDKVFIFIPNITTGYLTATFNGTIWTAAYEGTGTSLSALGDSGFLHAVYLPYVNDATPVYSNNTWTFNTGTDSYFFFASKQSYKVETVGEDHILLATIQMQYPGDYVQFFIPYDNPTGTIQFACNALRPAGFAGITADNIKLSAAYIPEGYENTSGSEAAVMLRKSGDSYYNDAWYCRASVYEAKDFNITEYNVESQTELEDNGHKIVIIKHVVSANNLGLSYIAYKYFDVEQAVVEVVFEGMTRTGQAVIPEYEEVEKIVRGIQATQGEVSTSVSYGDDYTPGAISDYDPYEDVIGGNYTEISVGGEFKTEVANFDETAKSITVSFKSLTDMKDRNSLDRDGFYSAGEKISLADRFFDDDGKLIVEYDKEIVDDYGDGINSLPQTHVEKYHRHFIVAEVEVTAEEDITDLNKVMGAVAYSKTVDSLSMVDTELIYDSTIGPISVAKGETVTVTLGLITAEEAEGTAYFEISTMNDAASEGKVVLLNVNS